MVTEQFDLEGEEFKDIKQIQGIIQISNLGRLRRKYKKGWKYFLGGRCRKNRYRRLDYYINNKVVFRDYIHDLVVETFNRPLKKGEVVHHKNENILDNRLENLDILTIKRHNEIHNKGQELNKKRPYAPHRGHKHSQQTKRKISQTKRNKKGEI